MGQWGIFIFGRVVTKVYKVFNILLCKVFTQSCLKILFHEFSVSSMLKQKTDEKCSLRFLKLDNPEQKYQSEGTKKYCGFV